MKYIIVLCLSVLVFSCFDSRKQEKNNEELLEVFHSISSNELMNFVSELSSEKYKGRLSGSPEFLEVAKWCAKNFEEWGLKPANNGSYFQYFKNEYSDVKSLGEVVYTNNKEQKKLVYLDDYLPGSNSAGGKVEAPMVYVGYGITAPELGYDDYKNVDVKGKIIILESGIPYKENDTTMLKWNRYAYHRYKARNALKHGAAGMLYLSKVHNPNTVNLNGFIYAHIDKKVVEQIFADAGKDYQTVKQQLKNTEPVSFALPDRQTVKISAETEYFPEAKACNVVGLIEGSDPVLKDEIIIIGAHLDGQGHMGDVLLPGALDNGSGSSDIMGAAKALASSPVKPKRSVLFILFGGEECGLYGSTYYCKNPLFPIEKTIMMMNLDMVGNGTSFFIEGGKSYPELYNHFSEANDKYIHRKMECSAVRKNYGRPRTDGSMFEYEGIKTMGLWTRNSVYEVYYHDPRDKTNVLTPEIMEDAAKLLYLGVLGVANDTCL